MTDAPHNLSLPPMPIRVAALPRDHRGYSIPWFVYVDANGPRFEAVQVGRAEEAIKGKGRCWICGEAMGQYKVFVIGPMCGVNRVSAEPPSHLLCAEFAATACPFLVKPRMKRMPVPPDAIAPPGDMIARNPGVTALWVTKSFRTFRPDQTKPGILFSLGPPVEVRWYAEGRMATLDEVTQSIASGMPILTAAAEKGGEADLRELLQMTQDLMPYLPRAEPALVAE